MSEPSLLHHLKVAKTTRTYLLGAPGDRTGEIWIACHGYGQLAGRFIRQFDPLVSESRVIAAPEALHRFYLDPPDRPAAERRVGATWMTREDRENDIADYVSYLDDVCGTLLATAPRARVVGFGFSQGAATISRWAVATEIRIGRLILWGSGLPPDLDWARAEVRLRSIPLLFVAGDRDAFATPARVAEQEALLRQRGVRFEVHRFSGGHSVEPNVLLEVGASGA